MQPDVVRYGQHASQYLELWPAATSAARRGMVVAVHGGWWRAQHDLHLMDPLCAMLSGAGWAVANLEFRRTGGDDGGWPQTLDDVTDAVEGLDRDPGEPLVLMGHSAGGHLALCAAPRVSPDAVVALAPVTDLPRCAEAGLGEDATPLFMGDADADTYLVASPVVHLPLGVPQLVVHGSADMRVPVGHSRDYVRRGLALGDRIAYLEIEGGDHFCVVDPQHESWEQVARWIAGDAVGSEPAVSSE